MIGWYKPQVGGGSQVIQNIVKYLKTNDITIINMEEIGFQTGMGHWKDNNINVFQERVWCSKHLLLLQTMFQTTKRALILQKNIDLFHTHSDDFSGIGFINKKKPLVLTMHGYPTLETIASGRIKSKSLQFHFLRMLELSALQRANAITTVGRTIREWIINELNIEPSKIFYIPNGVDVDKIDKIRNNSTNKSEMLKKQMGLENRRIILFVKAFTKQNGLLTLIESLPLILKKHKDAHLVAIGGGPLKNQAISLSKKLEVDTNVTLIDRIPNEQVPVYFNFSEVFTVPFVPLYIFGEECAGVGDTLGIAHLEAMAAGLPVVATAVGNLDELEAEIGNSLIYIKPDNPISLANAIVYLLDHPKIAGEIGKRGRKFILEKYTWEKIVEQYSNVYKYAIES